MIVFGGHDGTSRLNDLWRLSLAEGDVQCAVWWLRYLHQPSHLFDCPVWAGSVKLGSTSPPILTSTLNSLTASIPAHTPGREAGLVRWM